MPLRILLADENLAVQKMVEMSLGREGMEVTVTDNGLSALDLALKRTPDLILADFNLEGLDIFAFVQKIKRHQRLSETPVILLVNATQPYDPERFPEGDVAAFFKKPLDAEDLLDAVRQHTKSDEPLPLEGEPSETETTDISSYFSSPEDESVALESLLGWSSPKAPDSIEASKPVSDASEDPSDPPDETLEAEPQGGQSTTSFSFDHPPQAVESPETSFAQADSEKAPASPFPFDSEEPPVFGTAAPKSPETPLVPSETGEAEAESACPPSLSESELPASPELEDKTPPSGGQAEGASSSDNTRGEASNVFPEASDGKGEGSEVNTAEDALEAPAPAMFPADQAPSTSSETPEVLDEKSLREPLQEKGRVQEALQESLEKVIWEVLPNLLRTALSKELVAQTVEKVVWETVVPLAEAEIKQEIRRIREGTGNGIS